MVRPANGIAVPSTCDFSAALRIYGANAAIDVVAVDVEGVYAPGTGGFSSVRPARIADTARYSTPAVATVAGGSHITVQVASDGIPADAKAVALNVRAIGPNGPGNLRVVPRWCRSAVRQQAEPPDRHVFGHAPRTKGAAAGRCRMAFVRREHRSKNWTRCSPGVGK